MCNLNIYIDRCPCSDAPIMIYVYSRCAHYDLCLCGYALWLPPSALVVPSCEWKKRCITYEQVLVLPVFELHEGLTTKVKISVKSSLCSCYRWFSIVTTVWEYSWIRDVMLKCPRGVFWLCYMYIDSPQLYNFSVHTNKWTLADS